MEGNNIGLATNFECGKKKKINKFLKKKRNDDFPYKAKKIFGLEVKNDEKK